MADTSKIHLEGFSEVQSVCQYLLCSGSFGMYAQIASEEYSLFHGDVSSMTR